MHIINKLKATTEVIFNITEKYNKIQTYTLIIKNRVWGYVKLLTI